VNLEDFESEKTYASGYIVREWCKIPSNFRSHGNINDFLKKQKTIGLYGIDTRSLTRKIREFGVMNGAITDRNVFDEDIKQMLLDEINNFSITQSVENTTSNEVEIFNNHGKKPLFLWITVISIIFAANWKKEVAR
jgi:carbamoyl-phosphate synthase small subunit